MVFQKPNPFPKSIYDNVAFGPRVLGMTREHGRHASSTRSSSAALWDEVKDRLKKSALSLSGGQQQRLCIARCLAVEPDVLLMDEPASALDPIATTRIEDLMHELKKDYTIVIVTHNMQQAARVADMTAFFSVEVGRRGPPDRDPRRVRHDTEDLHAAQRQANGGLRHGAGSASHAGHSPTGARPARRQPPRRGRAGPAGAPRLPQLARRIRTSSSPTRSSRSTTRSTRATSRSKRGSSRSSRARRRSRSTFASCSPPSTSTSTSSAWPTTA